ncbi:unnamed protein product [Mucor hiemalis]
MLAKFKKVSKSAWKKFWGTKLNSTNRNVVYRFIHKKIPHRHLMHRIFPEKTTSSLCQLCNNHDEDANHMLFLCHFKRNIWNSTLRKYFGGDTKYNYRTIQFHIPFFP